MRLVRGLGLTALAFVVLVSSNSTSFAGEKRVNVASNLFSPNIVNVNPGDHVVWIWVAGGHSVTEGTGCNVSTPLFDSGTKNLPASFSWKVDVAGPINYFCIPHCFTGVINTSTGQTHSPIAEFRITEVHRTDGHENDYVEIANIGDAQGDIRGFRISVDGATSATLRSSDTPMNANERMVVHFGQSGTDSPTNVFIPGTTLGAFGSAALYVPNSVTPSLDLADMMVDFVQWGASGQAHEATAVSAGLWTSGQFAGLSPGGNAIEFCGSASDVGPTFWLGINTPNPGSDGNCASPVVPTTWGGIKTLNR